MYTYNTKYGIMIYNYNFKAGDIMNIDKALTPDEVAKILKIAKNTVYELIKRGELPAYKVGRKVRVNASDLEEYMSSSEKKTKAISSEKKITTNDTPPSPNMNPSTLSNNTLVICGKDRILDLLADMIQHHPNGVPTLRSYVGSYPGLTSLYYGTAHLASTHLWDGDTGEYNSPYVRRLLPGTPSVIIHLAKRTVGFYVAKGNPKKITNWAHLTRDDVVMINREKGSGIRVLLDEHLRKSFISPHSINGYFTEETSHLAIASTVSAGKADVGIGCESAALNIQNIDFIPLQKEDYDMVVKKEDMKKAIYRVVYDIICSEEFKTQIQGLYGYDFGEIGTIVDET